MYVATVLARRTLVEDGRPHAGRDYPGWMEFSRVSGGNFRPTARCLPLPHLLMVAALNFVLLRRE
jgi:hypothetical protein